MKRGSNSAAGGASKKNRTGLLDVGEASTRLKINRDKFCDVKLRVGNEVFPAHRAVLAAGSGFLAALFDGQFKDSAAPVVDIHEMEPRSFALALDYMYDGKCAAPDVIALQQMLSVASILQMDALLVDVVTVLENGITVDNCTSMLACADHHHLPQLKNKAEAVAHEAFVAVASNPAVSASIMLALLQSDHLNVNSEQEVFETLVTWIKGQAQPLGEEEQMEMFGLVRFALLSKDFVDLTVMAEPACSTPRACKLLLAQFKDAFFGDAKPQQRGGKNKSNVLSAKAYHQVLSWLDTVAAKKLELLYCSSKNGWGASDLHSRCDNKGPTVTVIKCTDGYVFGGFMSSSMASTGKWTKCADAFIFSLHRPGSVGPVKLALQAEHAGYAMIDHASCLTHFGLSDIVVLDGANSTFPNSTTLRSYALPPGHAPVDANTFFTGAKDFQAAEIEVFRVLA